MYKTLLLLLLFALTGFAQNFTVSGEVSDPLTADGLPYANVRVLENGKGTSTNRYGKFSLLLPKGRYTLVASFIGYVSDTARITVSGNMANVTLLLTASQVTMPEVTVLPAENPALEVMRRAYARRLQRENILRAYTFSAYTKSLIRSNAGLNFGSNSAGLGLGAPDSAALAINGIFENQSMGYFKAPGKYKEVITARRQTANIPPTINTLTGGRVVQNFYTDDVNFFGRKITSPLSEDALDFYYFRIEDTIAIDNNPVFRIAMLPDDSRDPGFFGYIYIGAAAYDLLKVELELNRAANTGGIFDTVRVTQQFFPFGAEQVYLPVDYNLFLRANLLGLAKVGFEVNTIMYDYAINTNISDETFNRAVLTVTTDADAKDSLFWAGSQTISRTDEEETAYKQFDSISAASKSFWDDFSFLAEKFKISKYISIPAPLSIYRFNRAEGSTLRFNFSLDEYLDDRLTAGTLLAYGFADHRVKYNLSGEYRLGDYRTTRLSGSLWSEAKTLYEEQADYGDFFTTLNSLLTKYEFNDYFYSSGWRVAGRSELLPILTGTLQVEHRSDKAAPVNSTFSLFARGKSPRPNRQVTPGTTGSVKLGFTLDFRNYIEDGKYRRRVGGNLASIILTGGVTLANPSLFAGSTNFTSWALTASGGIPNVGNARLFYQLNAYYATGAVPYQLLAPLPGNINLTGRRFSFRTLGLNQAAADRGYAIYLEQDFREDFFRVTGLNVLSGYGMQVKLFMNMAATALSSGSAALAPEPGQQFNAPLFEAGFTMGHVLIPLQLEFAWRLTHREQNGFSISLSTPFLD